METQTLVPAQDSLLDGYETFIWKTGELPTNGGDLLQDSDMQAATWSPEETPLDLRPTQKFSMANT